jgi:hypothetical protein
LDDAIEILCRKNSEKKHKNFTENTKVDCPVSRVILYKRDFFTERNERLGESKQRKMLQTPSNCYRMLIKSWTFIFFDI